MKICSECGENKKIEDYQRVKGLSGEFDTCKSCRKKEEKRLKEWDEFRLKSIRSDKPLESQVKKIFEEKVENKKEEIFFSNNEINDEELTELERIKLENKLLKQKLEIFNKSFVWIYCGSDPVSNKSYIGQTTNSPERRWVQHREKETGPFKDGAIDIEWKVLERVPVHNLDEHEAYWIGFFNAFENGFNDNRGNDLAAYLRGQKEAEKTSRSKHE